MANKRIWRALRRLQDDVGKPLALEKLQEAGISGSAGYALLRRKYKLKHGGTVYRKILPVLDPYMGDEE